MKCVTVVYNMVDIKYTIILHNAFKYYCRDLNNYYIFITKVRLIIVMNIIIIITFISIQ